jgi:16S rRNA (cytosine967-C5)-methyltransferase
MLDAGFDMLRSGGRLVYCTCSLEREEGEDQIAAFLKRTPDARLDPVAPEELPGLERAIMNGAVRTRPDMWSDQGGVDGFYIARIFKA